MARVVGDVVDDSRMVGISVDRMESCISLGVRVEVPG